MQRFTFVVAVLLMLLFTVSAYAQKFGKITGTVIDVQTGDPLPGANIFVVGTTMGAASNLEGKYTILRMPPGDYVLRANFIGYQGMVVQNVEVLTDLTTTIDFKLNQATVELGTELVVVAEKPIIRKDLTSSEARVQAEEIDRLPVQELGDLLNLQAGINRDKDGGIHIRGGRSTEVAYMVNGIRITDDFTRTQAIQVENESIQELQVISGTFNAEYGEALSGIINIVTKTGGNEFHGNFEAWSGDYVSANDEIFFNVDDVNPNDNYNLQGSLSGPIIKDKLTFYVTVRRFVNDGYLYGANAFNPQLASFQIVDDVVQLVPFADDSSAVPLNFNKRWSGQASLEWRISAPLKLKFDFLGSKQQKGKYEHDLRLNPMGIRDDEEQGLTVIGALTHALGANTFYEITGSYKENKLESVLFDDPNDPRYRSQDFFARESQTFFQAGTQLDRFNRSTKSWIGKFDLTSQVNHRHQVKTGVEVKFDKVFLDDTTLEPDPNSQTFQFIVPDPTGPNRDLITRKPFTFAAYVQDKIEYESLIINVGLRFDMFNPKGRIPVDLSDPNIFNPLKLANKYRDSNGDGEINPSEQTPANELTVQDRESYWYQETSIKTQVSPRLGVAYPITDEGVIHFSFGIFRQTPDYEQLYRGDQLKVPPGASGLQGGKGGNGYANPDLEPQRTTMYELGLQQQLHDNLGADVTLFYRDIRDWITTGPSLSTAIGGLAYARRINRDFANVLGITLALNRRFANNFSFSADYTFQVAEGTNSNPQEEFFTQRDEKEPTKQLTPLEWDQTHAFNASLFVGSGSWGFSLIERFSSGQPFTPEINTFGQSGRDIIGGLEKNSRRKPSILSFDLTGFKEFYLSTFKVKVFAKVFNLFDAKNPKDIFADTGEADFTFDQSTPADPTFFIRPDFYSEPRRVQVGMSFGF